MGGSKLDLLRIKALALTLIGEHAAKATAALSQLEAPHAYECQSGDIFTVLDSLMKELDVDENEFERNEYLSDDIIAVPNFHIFRIRITTRWWRTSSQPTS